MPLPGRRSRPSLPLLSKVFLINAAMLTAATVALALSPATVSFPIALTEAVILGGGLAATLALDLLVLRRVLGAALVPAVSTPIAEGTSRPAVLPQAVDPSVCPSSARPGPYGTSADGETDNVGTRLLVGWSRPYHLSDADAEAWAQAELTRVLAVAGTDRARLTRLRSASLRHHRPWDWLLEVDVAPGGGIRHCVESPAWRELLDDLRQLGMRPAAMVADTERVLKGERV